MSDNMIIIGLIGEKGSGKDSAAKYIATKYNTTHYGGSKILKRIAENLNIPLTRDNLIKIGLILKEGFGPAVVMNSIIKEIEKDGSKIAVVDGIRMHGDQEPFREKYKNNFYLIYIKTDIKTRFERSKKRGEKEGEKEMDFKQFLEEEGRLTEISIKEIGEKADFIIDNNGTEESLYGQIDEVMGKIII